MNFKNDLIQYAKEANIEITEEQATKFENYKDLLLEWNEKINLTSITDQKEIIIKHFIDSLTVLNYLEIIEETKVLDLGTGAGFPGIPLKIMNENIHLYLMDSLNKRINFLKDVGEKLKFENVAYIHQRAEDGGKSNEYREQFDYVLSRAVAPLNVLSEYSLPLTKIGGTFIAYKGPDTFEEVVNAKNTILKLGGNLKKIVKVKLPETEIVHSLVIITKISQTPAKYPRKPKVIRETPMN